jgi:thiol-disulfide isomerase/thioredoxin
MLAFAGCKSTDPKPADREPAGTAASRTRNGDSKGPTWLDPAARNTAADSADPRKSSAQDSVGGRVVDAFNRPARGVFIRVEPVTPAAGSPGSVGIQTDQNGYFSTRGLKPGKSYNLTAEATIDGKQYMGAVQTLVPNTVLTIVLRDDLAMPPAGILKGGSGNSTFPPPPGPSDPGSDHIPAMGVTPRPADGAWAPGSDATKPVPPSIGGPSSIPPAPTGVGPAAPSAPPPPDDLSAPPKPTLRPDNVADGPRGPFSAPPPANIPGPPSLPPTFPTPYPVPPVDPKPPGMGMVPRITQGFTLLDTLERPWEFPADKAGSLVLIEFMTTTCVHCKSAVPVLSDLQSRYGASGLQVIAVACDDLPQRARAAAAARYAQDHNLTYSVFVEPGSEPGGVRNRYDIEGYPTVVLLDGNGRVLWKGHPNKRHMLENAIKSAPVPK